MSSIPFCPNCYHPDPGEYCPECGQKQAERRVSLRQLVGEFLDEQFGVNGRLPRTLKALLLRPGFLTTEYFNGRVQQYIPPLRLYLFTSVLFFAVFLLSQSSAVHIEREAEDVKAELEADTALQRKVRASRGSGAYVGIRLDPSDTSSNWLENPEVNLGYAPFNQAVKRRLQEFAAYGEVEGTRRLVRAIFAQMPKVVFALLPLYALLLWLFFRKQRKYYVEHFILGLHLHSFGFLALLPANLLDLPGLPNWMSDVGDTLSAFILVWVFIYIFLALRRVYRQGRLITAVKYFFLWILYTVFFAFSVIISGVLALTTG